jgi:hypothetical protein
MPGIGEVLRNNCLQEAGKMSNGDKVDKLLKTHRDPQELHEWMFSLAPLGVAFAFFLVFVWSVDLPNKDVIVITGIAAGFIGLESFWMIRGWRKNHIVTVQLGGWVLLQRWWRAVFAWR